MPYSEKQFKTSNTNYLDRDFSELKSALMQYAKAYFPNTYRDFNETSPGMMFIEMAAYVGDILNFYIDKQYKEMMLPLAEERKNVINIAKMLGYKVKPSSPAYVNLTVTQLVDANATDITHIKPNYDQAIVLDKGIQLKSQDDSNIFFETLDVVDFTVSSSIFEPEPTGFDDNGLITEYTLTREVQAIGAKTKIKTFNVGTPRPFLELVISDTNVVDILSVKDTNGNKWYEVDYLAQDKVPIETHYTDDWVNQNPDTDSRENAYRDFENNTIDVQVPYTLEYIQTPKRFMTEINEDNTTSLLFGNGLLRTGTTGSLQSGYFQTQQAGITIPGEPSSFNESISPVVANVNSSLGEIPSNTDLVVTYRIGGGIESNVGSLELINPTNLSVINSPSLTAVGRSVSIANNEPARGGNNAETVDEIKHRARAHFLSQNRAVTKEDYEARTLSMPAKFGNIAKVFARRANFPVDDEGLVALNELRTTVTNALDFDNTGYNDTGDIAEITNAVVDSVAGGVTTTGMLAHLESISGLVQYMESFNANYGQASQPITQIPTVELYTLSYNNLTQLSQTPNLIHMNLKKYLNQYRIISDAVNIKSGYIINFGVYFDVVAHKGENKHDIKLKCIAKIMEYFSILKMQFHQTMYTSEIEYELMDIDGVRSVNFVQLGQGTESSDLSDYFEKPLWDMTGVPGVDDTSTGTNEGYGWYYDFKQFYDNSQPNQYGIIIPSVEPAVFELKHPTKNIKGVVR
tara:strand:- start:319 stop:2553 length:2235 start_codon:yes stop_codon:yes gene_type:complete